MINTSPNVTELGSGDFDSLITRTLIHEKKISAQLLNSSKSGKSLTHVLGQSEHVKDIVEECVDDLSSVNTGLKHQLLDDDASPDIEYALEMSEAVEGKVQDASEAVSLVNSSLEEQINERHIIDAQLATVTQQADDARHVSLHDPLTGLPNRALFNDRLEHGLSVANRNGHSFAVMFLDLDKFKLINDSHGHDVGDLVLQIVAKRLKETTRDDDTVCRYGGDEFLYILVNIESEHDTAIVAEKIINALQEPYDIRVRDIHLSLSINTSIGISIFPKDGTTSVALLDIADKAMYRAKHKKSGYSFSSND